MAEHEASRAEETRNTRCALCDKEIAPGVGRYRMDGDVHIACYDDLRRRETPVEP